MAALFFQLVIAFAMLGMVVGFMPTSIRSSTRFAGKLMMTDVNSLEAKLAAKMEAKAVSAAKVVKVEKKVESKVAEKKASPAPKTATATVKKTSPVVTAYLIHSI